MKETNKVFDFTITDRMTDQQGNDMLGRTATYTTPHGTLETPCFVTVGTKATVKGLTPEMIASLGSQVFLANTYHLYLAPGEDTVAAAGGLHTFANWPGPMMTDSGGFQVLSLGAAFGSTVSKIADANTDFSHTRKNENKSAMAKITEEGVEFRSIKDGSKHFFTPERSMQIQQKLGADMYFAFDECTSPQASYDYQVEAMDRTHRWAKRSLDEHQRLEKKKTGVINQIKEKITKDTTQAPQALFGVVQGGRHFDLRTESARILGEMDFDGYGIGGSFNKDDMATAVQVACAELPENKPRHLLGIGEVIDLFLGVENGIDTFDCVSPTRMARHGSVHTKNGKVNIMRAAFRKHFKPIEEDCDCYTCQNYTAAYVCHLLREKEMFGATLASIHNLRFIVRTVDEIRESIKNGSYWELKEKTLKQYYGDRY